MLISVVTTVLVSCAAAMHTEVLTTVPLNASLATVMNRDNQPTLHIKMTNRKIHVGNYQGLLLKNSISAAITKICPQNYRFGERNVICNGPKYAWIEGVEAEIYTGKLVLTPIRVEVPHARLPYGYHGLRENLIEQIALTFMAMSQDKKNCHNWPKDISKYWCNVGHSVRVEVENHPSKGMMEVALESATQRPGRDGHFDCVAIVDMTRKYLDDKKGDFMHSLGLSRVNLNVECPNKEITR